MASESPYRDKIAQLAEDYGYKDIDPRHIEAYMRLENGTLDGLSAAQFADEVLYGISCTVLEGTQAAEKLAKSFGL